MNNEPKPGPGGAFLIIAFVVLFATNVTTPWWCGVIAWLYLGGGILWLIFKARHFAEKEGTNIWAQFILMIEALGDTLWLLIIWPLDFVLTRFRHGHCSPREQLGQYYLDELLEEEHRFARWMYQAALDKQQEAYQNAVITGRSIEELPQTINIQAKKTCVWGTASFAMVSATPAVAGTNTFLAGASVTTSALMSGVTRRSFHDQEAETRLENARIRLVLDTPSGFGGTFEAEAAGIETKTTDWPKKLFATAPLGDGAKLHLGRLPGAPVFLVPNPFLLETVNPPRRPFTIGGWGAELEEPLTPEFGLRATLTGRTGTRFDDSGQFDQPHGSLRLEWKPGPKISLAFTGQAAEEFLRLSLDTVWRPSSRFLGRMAVYGAEENETSRFGGFVFGAYRPLSWLEIHGQTDYQNTLGLESRDWLKTTAGIRLWSRGERWSLTTDLESSFPANNHAVVGRLMYKF